MSLEAWQGMVADAGESNANICLRLRELSAVQCPMPQAVAGVVHDTVMNGFECFAVKR